MVLLHVNARLEPFELPSVVARAARPLRVGVEEHDRATALESDVDALRVAGAFETDDGIGHHSYRRACGARLEKRCDTAKRGDR